MQVPVKDIIVRKRLRKDLGDINALAESLKTYGLISPIVISRDNVLIAGGRRLEAAKRLGWRTINAVVSEAEGRLAVLELEAEENFQRQPFNVVEAETAVKKINRLRNPSFFLRIWYAVLDFFGKIARFIRRK